MKEENPVNFITKQRKSIFHFLFKSIFRNHLVDTKRKIRTTTTTITNSNTEPERYKERDKAGFLLIGQAH